MGAAMAVTSLGRALVIHAVAAPAIFAALSLFYFRGKSAMSPLRAAALFLAVVAAMDFLLVASVIERSYAMFASLMGTWLPFAEIFVATWLTGVAVKAGNRE